MRNISFQRMLDRLTLLLLPLAMACSTGSGQDAACSVTQNPDGSVTFTCPDGSSATLHGDDDQGDDDSTGSGDDDSTGSGDDDSAGSGDDDSSGSGDDDSTGSGDDDSTGNGDDDSTGNGDDDSTGSGDDDTPVDGTVLEGSYTINNSLDVGLLASFTAVTGDLLIEAPGLTSLAGLEGLTSIGGDLTVSSSSDLESLAGLDGLNAIGGHLTISSCSSLESLTGLDGLENVGSDIKIYGNGRLADLRALTRLTAVPGSMSVEYNALTNLEGLEHIRTVAYNLVLSESTLSDLSALANLEAVGGSVQVDAGQIERFDLPSLASVGGGVRLAGGTGTLTIALPMLSYVGGGYVSLQSIDASDLRWEGPAVLPASLQVNSNYGPVRIDFSGLESVEGDLLVVYMYDLTELDLSGVQSVGGQIELEGLSALVSLDLSGLEVVSDRCWINGVNDLRELNLSGLSSASMFYAWYNWASDYYDEDALEYECGETAGSICIIGAENLEVLELDGLTSVGSTLGLEGLVALTRLEMPSLVTAVGDVWVGGSGPETISMPLLETVGSLGIWYDYRLQDINLDSLRRIDGNLYIGQNESLPACEAQAVVDQVMAADGIGGEVTVEENSGVGDCE